MMFFDSLKPKVSFRSEGAKAWAEVHLLEPMLTIADAGGPMKTMPSSASRSENLAFSLRKPYLR